MQELNFAQKGGKDCFKFSKAVSPYAINNTIGQIGDDVKFLQSKTRLRFINLNGRRRKEKKKREIGTDVSL